MLLFKILLTSLLIGATSVNALVVARSPFPEPECESHRLFSTISSHGSTLVPFNSPTTRGPRSDDSDGEGQGSDGLREGEECRECSQGEAPGPTRGPTTHGPITGPRTRGPRSDNSGGEGKGEEYPECSQGEASEPTHGPTPHGPITPVPLTCGVIQEIPHPRCDGSPSPMSHFPRSDHLTS